MADVIRIGYGEKLVHRAFKEAGLSPGELREKTREEKAQKIRELILAGCSVKQIVKDTVCAEATVVKERRFLAAKGYPVRLNKRRAYEENPDGA